eukprot:5653978-Amphidinium_carterae.1
MRENAHVEDKNLQYVGSWVSSPDRVLPRSLATEHSCQRDHRCSANPNCKWQSRANMVLACCTKDSTMEMVAASVRATTRQT